MGANTAIEWTDATWNPIRGCSRVSEGCRNCYAEKVAYRFSGPGQPYEGLVRFREVLRPGSEPPRYDRVRKPEWNGQVRFVEEHLLDPLKWGPVKAHGAECEKYAEVRDSLKLQCKCPTRPRRIFVNSMSDLFHENVPDEWIDRIFAVMALCPQHTFQILTKRPERMLAWFTGLNTDVDAIHRAVAACHFAAGALRHMLRGDQFDAMESIPRGLPNVWLGVSVENQKAADERIPLLLQTPAAVRFISAEPPLEEIDLIYLNREPSDFDRAMPGFEKCAAFYADALFGSNSAVMKDCDLRYAEPDGTRPKLDWVICGGESGPRARPMHPDWARSLRDQCQAAGVPFFFKQWGEWWPGSDARQPELTMYSDGRTCEFTKDAIEAEEARSGLRHNKHQPTIVSLVGKKAAGAMLDGREWREFPSPQRRGPVAGDPDPAVRA